MIDRQISGREWFVEFLDAGPVWPAQRRSVAEMQALIVKAGIGAGLPLGHAQDLGSMAASFMCDAQLIGMLAAALDGPFETPVVTQSGSSLTLAEGSVLMRGPLAVDALVEGHTKVILPGLDYDLLLWPMLCRAQTLFSCNFAMVRDDDGTVTLSYGSAPGLEPPPSPDAVPDRVIARLETFAERTFVPETQASRLSGAGSGALNDND